MPLPLVTKSQSHLRQNKTPIISETIQDRRIVLMYY